MNNTPKRQIEPSGEPETSGDEPGDTDERGPEIRNELVSRLLTFQNLTYKLS